MEVDAFCRTSLPDIYAIGDCAAFACDFAGGQVIRVESVQNANDMATCVAKVICGDGKPYKALPWFWSKQFDLNLQTVGINAGFDSTIIRGEVMNREFSVVYLKVGVVVAIDCVNMVKDYVQGHKLVQGGSKPDLDRLADPSVSLKEFELSHSQ